MNLAREFRSRQRSSTRQYRQCRISMVADITLRFPTTCNTERPHVRVLVPGIDDSPSDNDAPCMGVGRRSDLALPQRMQLGAPQPFAPKT